MYRYNKVFIPIQDKFLKQLNDEVIRHDQQLVLKLRQMELLYSNKNN
jgi:hypothetical protein